MEAGRELDSLVATKIMGLNVVATDWPCGYQPDDGNYEAHFIGDIDRIGGEGWQPDIVYLKSDRVAEWPPKLIKYDHPYYAGARVCYDLEPVPFYSTDLLAAWSVIEKLPVSSRFSLVFGLDLSKLLSCSASEVAFELCCAALTAVDYQEGGA